MNRFAEALERHLGKLEHYKGAHHDQIRHLFLCFLREAFPELEELDTVEIEHGIRFLKVRGFIDLLIGDLVFEIKRDIERERDDGIRELEKYLPALPHPENTLGIITDGSRFEVYELRDGSLTKLDEFVLRAENPEEALLWLDSYLFQREDIEPTVSDISFRFGQRSLVFKRASEALAQMWKRVKGDPAARTKFEEWDALLRTVYGSKVGNTELFLRHTYLALLVRLLAFGALTGRSPDREELEGIVTGEGFEQMGFRNLVEEDFYAWPMMPQVAIEAKSFLEAISRASASTTFPQSARIYSRNSIRSSSTPKPAAISASSIPPIGSPNWLFARLAFQARVVAKHFPPCSIRLVAQALSSLLQCVYCVKLVFQGRHWSDMCSRISRAWTYTPWQYLPPR